MKLIIKNKKIKKNNHGTQHGPPQVRVHGKGSCEIKLKRYTEKSGAQLRHLAASGDKK